MSHAEEILGAAYRLFSEKRKSFTRENIRSALGIPREEWVASYNPIFQAMRIDQPGGAPGVAASMRDTMRRIARGIYVLTEYGLNQGRVLASGHIHVPLQITEEGKPNLAEESEKSTHTFTSRHTSPMLLNYANKVENILSNSEIYHESFYRSEVFGNPCLYFHRKALETNREPSSEKHLEYVYATLIAWGMNRLGSGGSKMHDFETFSESIRQMNDSILEAKIFDCHSMKNNHWPVLENIFKGIKVMKSGTSLVGNSKVMHHMLPNIIPPIDRTYTLTLLQGNANLRNDINGEWLLIKAIIESFFIPVASDEKFQLQANRWMDRINEYPWDTSLLKVIDNIIIGQKKKNNLRV